MKRGEGSRRCGIQKHMCAAMFRGTTEEACSKWTKFKRHNIKWNPPEDNFCLHSIGEKEINRSYVHALPQLPVHWAWCRILHTCTHEQTHKDIWKRWKWTKFAISFWGLISSNSTLTSSAINQKWESIGITSNTRRATVYHSWIRYTHFG